MGLQRCSLRKHKCGSGRETCGKETRTFNFDEFLAAANCSSLTVVEIYTPGYYRPPPGPFVSFFFLSIVLEMLVGQNFSSDYLFLPFTIGHFFHPANSSFDICFMQIKINALKIIVFPDIKVKRPVWGEFHGKYERKLALIMLQDIKPDYSTYKSSMKFSSNFFSR